MGGPIPESYYRHDLKSEKEQHLKTVQVKKGDVFKVEMKIERSAFLQYVKTAFLNIEYE